MRVSVSLTLVSWATEQKGCIYILKMVIVICPQSALAEFLHCFIYMALFGFFYIKRDNESAYERGNNLDLAAPESNGPGNGRMLPST